MGMAEITAAEERARKPAWGAFRKVIYWVGFSILFIGCLTTGFLMFSNLSDPNTVVDWPQILGCIDPEFGASIIRGV
jgi:hypothetical protein